MISEVYGGGGNSGAQFKNDFIELYNPTDAPVDLTGWSVQYRSGTGTGAATAASTTNLSGTIPANAHFLIQEAAGAGGSVDLPEADVVGTIAMGGSGGQVWLSNGTTLLDPPDGNIVPTYPSTIVDFVGYANNANTYEGTRIATNPGNAQSLSRDEAAGAIDDNDSDDNGVDLTLTSPATPTNAAGEVVDPPQEVTGTIAEFQGTGATSPFVGDIATTQGVVTAVYPTGGFDGFYLQTGGTGGGADTTPGASDGIFVYGPTFDESTLALGDSVEVVGPVSEFNGLTEITATTVTDIAALDPVTPLATGFPTSDAEREAHEGELLAPTGPFTVTNTFTTNQFAEIGLASGTTPLRQWTDVAPPGTPAADAVIADNAARKVALDDGASIDFLSTANNRANMQITLPWLTPTKSVRVGAEVTFTGPVVMDYRNNSWKFQPQERVTDDGADVATFEDTRVDNTAPQAVGGDLKLATFNVLNYFNTTGTAFDDRAGTTCSYFFDRTGEDPVAVNSCTPDGPRGAAELGDFNRQQAKIVRAINTLDADIVSLEEIENSVKLVGETNRDDAVSALVSALNTAAGSRRWAYAPSPAAADLPTLAEQDVIRNAFIYDPTTVSPVGASKVLVGSAPFANAREPLAQAFKRAGTSDASAFAVIANHFKSKSASGATGDNVDTGDGQGGYNGDRTRQAAALVAFADSFAAERGVDAVFLTGDLNSYTHEDPMQVLYDAGYDVVESDTADEYSYSFSGLSGSLDHVLGNAAAMAMVTGADIWEINANEPIAYQYSRFNYNPTQFFDRNDPFAASDHNPEVVGLDVAEIGTEVQILGTNDFHGRLLANGVEGGAAVLSGAVKQLKTENGNTVFTAAGDLIGASTFESFIQDDEPTIDALNEAGLEVSAAGNHEFDQGYEDFVGRVQDRADWEYIAANVEEPTGRDDLAETWVKDFGDVEVGFVGAVTEDLPFLVSPGGIEGVTVTDITDATNAAAAELKAAGAEAVVLLVHEGAPSTTYESATDPTNAFGAIVNGVSPDVDAIISGHTHLAYNHSVPVPEWETEGRAVTERPVVSAGQYGSNLNQLKFQFDDGGVVTGKSQAILAMATDADGSGPGTTFVANYPVDAATKAIVDSAVAVAETLGAQPLGEIDGAFNRAKLADGTTENRGGESTLGNLVAEVQRWATASVEAGEAQIAFMNPGGLRADMAGTAGDFPRVLTYKQAAVVQPFANTLVNMDLTGAKIKEALEQQWQRDSAGNVPTRPFLRLGTSEGFTYTYDPDLPEGSRITGMWLDGVPIDLGASYSVTVNSFLATGGDNFRAFVGGTDKRDTGKVDLEAMVDYMAEFAGTEPLPVDFTQRAVGANFPADAPASYAPGSSVQFELSSLSFTSPTDTRDSEVTVSLGGVDLGTFDVTTTVQAALPGFDEAGTASVDVTLPAGTPAGPAVLTVTGVLTGTVALVPITVGGDEPPGKVDATVNGKIKPNPVTVGAASKVIVTVRAPGVVPTGFVRIKVSGREATLRRLEDGRAVLRLKPFNKTGTKTVRIRYNGNASVNPATDVFTFRVVKR